MVCLLLGGCGCQNSTEEGAKATTPSSSVTNKVAKQNKDAGPQASGTRGGSRSPEDEHHDHQHDTAPAAAVGASSPATSPRSSGYAHSASREDYLKRTEAARLQREKEKEEEEEERRLQLAEREHEHSHASGGKSGHGAGPHQPRRARGHVVYEGPANSIPEDVMEMPNKIIEMNGGSIKVKVRQRKK